MLRKVISLAMVAALALSLATGCAPKTETPPAATQAAAAATDAPATTEPTKAPEVTETPAPTAPQAADLYPATDLKGVTLKINHYANPAKVAEADKKKWEDAKAAVEAKFNCKIEFVEFDGMAWDDIPKEIVKSVAAGDPLLDMGRFSRYYTQTFMKNDALIDLTDVVANYNMPKTYYEDYGQWLGKTIGFAHEPVTAWSGLAYNRDMITQAGMTKTPSEMFAEGKWSMTDMYGYLKELKTKLPADSYPMFCHPLSWAEHAGKGNGAVILDPKTNEYKYMDDAFFEVVEFYQKLIAEGLTKAPKKKEDGSYDYSTKFGEGSEIAIQPAASWDFAGYAGKFEFGYTPFPWGSKVTVTGDYKTLSDNYRSHQHDANFFSLIKGAEKKADPKAYLDLIFSYDATAGESKMSNFDLESKGLPIAVPGVGTPRDFATTLDMELWDWYTARVKFDNDQSVGDDDIIFFNTLRSVMLDGQAVRTSFESAFTADTASLKAAGYQK